MRRAHGLTYSAALELMGGREKTSIICGQKSNPAVKAEKQQSLRRISNQEEEGRTVKMKYCGGLAPT